MPAALDPLPPGSRPLMESLSSFWAPTHSAGPQPWDLAWAPSAAESSPPCPGVSGVGHDLSQQDPTQTVTKKGQGQGSLGVPQAAR